MERMAPVSPTLIDLPVELQSLFLPVVIEIDQIGLVLPFNEYGPSEANRKSINIANSNSFQIVNTLIHNQRARSDVVHLHVFVE